MAGEEKRHQMMQNLFGDQSEEEDEVESEHESNRQPDYVSDEVDGGPEPEGEGEVEGQGEAEIDSEGEPNELEQLHGESEDERDKSSQEVEIGDQREESEERYSESDEKGEYRQQVAESRRHDEVESGSERSGENLYAANEDDEVNQAQSPRSSGDEKDEDQPLHPAPEIRDVFGDSDDEVEEQAEYEVQNQIEDEHQSPIDEVGNYERDLMPENMTPDEDAPYYSEEEHMESKTKDKPVGPPLELEIPLCPPPAESDKMHMIKVSNIMGIDPKPFDPDTYEDEDIYVTDESGSKKRIRLENNVVRWRKVKNPDGTTSIESNARFVEWSDGSWQLQIGNEVLDISKQDAQHEQSHLFLRHGKGILQSQGRICSKMRFMPSSLASNSHRLLTALVDSRHRKVYKVKNCITDIDPEKEKEQREKAANQSIKANELLTRKKEKISRKYTQPIRRERQLSPGFLEDALEEEDDQDYYESRRSAARRRFEEDLEMEARAEKRIINAKKGPKDIPRKSAMPASRSSRRPVDFSDSEKEESEYETEGEEEEDSPQHRRNEEAEQDYEEDEEENEQREEEENYAESEEETEEPKHKSRDSRGSLKRKDIESDEDSPPRKTTTAHRRMKMVYESDDE
ncbi:protein LEO1 homolog isoform X2 [Andrographis paniculata]|uniref:protein LEO1 homolog isoform X2 n=1 Tax=Andrographis paniculata TaxID=175694 RepID=UPI0021E7367E|nr:protein LEO1 homolog isoform X2 [Andrographis paniculata]